MKHIVTFGEIMARIEMEDHYRFRQSLPGEVRLTFAGAEANVAASLAFMGRSTQFVTSLPQHAIADSCRAFLKSMDVGTDYILSSDFGRLGLYFLESGANQRPSNVIYDRDDTSISMQKAEAYDWDQLFTDAQWFHVSGITPAISRNAADATLLGIEKAKAHQIPVSFDLNYRKKLWNWGKTHKKKDLARNIIQNIMPSIDVVIGNEEDASDMLNIHPQHVDVNKGTIDLAAYASVAKTIAEQYPNLRYIAFTLRESISASHNNWGAMLYDVKNAKQYAAPRSGDTYTPYRITQIIDRVGGGDAFSAGLIYALTDSALSAHPQEIITYASATSCLCHSIHGDMNYSSREEVLRLAEGNGSGRVIR
ncbi:sugar kinase [Sediminispirochaeta bajacaliforniensis]|uniref:sugar kinase n=1 Tax=Sediminispirochaeta bajacaliforniensis TaxID=148 RepID=UPI00037AD7AC|nr:sugar kinase [Sediminispirochaeta bajacaliforniensis]